MEHDLSYDGLKITILTPALTEESIDTLMDSIGDLLAEHGLGTGESQPNLGSIVYAAPYMWPEDEQALLDRISAQGTFMVLVPSDGTLTYEEEDES